MTKTHVTVECEGLAHPEGPALLRDGRFVFVETYRAQVTSWRQGDGARTLVACGGAPNACAAGTDGIYITQMGGTIDGSLTATVEPSIQKIDWNGEVRTVALSVDGRALRAPNDLCFGPQGTLFFTDPGTFSLDDPEDGYIFSLSPNGECELAINVGPVFPNGIIALPDNTIVWVESYTRRVMRRNPDGALNEVATVPEGHMPDGFKASADGDLYIATISSGGIDVVGLDGTLHAFINTGGEPLNCLFSGESLFITDGGLVPYTDPASVEANAGRLLRVDVGVSGMPLFTGCIDEAVAPM